MNKPKSPTGPRPNRAGIYPAETWRKSNPDYEWSPPKHSPSGRVVEIDAGSWYDYEQAVKRAK